MSPARRFGTSVLVLLAACATPELSATDIQVGAAVGADMQSGTFVADSALVPDRDLEVDWSIAGFAELMLRGEPALHLRLLASDSTSNVQGTAATAEVRQAMVMPMLSFDAQLTGAVTLRPMFGLGFGLYDADFSSNVIADQKGLSVALAGGLQLDVADHAMLGVMGWSGLLGDPGDTEGFLDGLLVYVGVRF